MSARYNVNLGLTGLARAIALPGDHKPTRFPSFPALERTAVMGFQVPISFPCNTGTTKTMVMRQASYPVWFDQSYTGTWNYCISMITSPSATTVAGNLTDQTFIVEKRIQIAALGATAATDFTQAAWPPNSASLPFSSPIVAVDPATGSLPFIYVPPGASLIVIVNDDQAAVATGINIRLVLETWKAPGEVSFVQGLPSVPLSTQIAASKSGGFYTVIPSTTLGVWARVPEITAQSTAAFPAVTQFRVHIGVANYVPTYVPSITTAGTIVVGAAITTPMLLPIAAPPEISNSFLPYESTRTTAVSCLYTNVTKALNKEGTVLWGRVAPQNQNPWEAQFADITGLHPSEKAFLPLETGTYTYVPPSTDMAGFYDYTVNSIAVTRTPCVRLDNTSLVNVGFFTDPDGGTTLALTADWHFEFRTTSALFQIGLSPITLEAFHQSQLALVEAGFFFPNNSHRAILAKITNFANQAAKLVAPAQYKVLKTGFRTVKALWNGKAPKKASKKKSRGARRLPRQIIAKPGRSRPPATTLDVQTRPKMRGGLDMYLSSQGRK